jgi:hypothetical protein
MQWSLKPRSRVQFSVGLPVMLTGTITTIAEIERKVKELRRERLNLWKQGQELFKEERFLELTLFNVKIKIKNKNNMQTKL